MLVCDGSEVLLVGTLGCEPGGLGSTPSASLLCVCVVCVCDCECPHSVTDARLLAVQQEGVRLALGVHVYLSVCVAGDALVELEELLPPRAQFDSAAGLGVCVCVCHGSIV